MKNYTTLYNMKKLPSKNDILKLNKQLANWCWKSDEDSFTNFFYHISFYNLLNITMMIGDSN